MIFYGIKKYGQIVAAGDSDYEVIKRLKEGVTYKFTVKKDRNYEFHKKVFALLRIGFKNQDEIICEEIYRKLMIIRTGRFTGAEFEGVQIPIADSMDYERMDQAEIENLYNDILNLLIKDLHISSEDIETELSNFY